MRRPILALCFLVAASAVAQPSPTVDKLVGTNPGTVCASGSDAISVLPGTTVYYCYSFTNLTGDPVTVFAEDDHIGEVMKAEVEPGNSTSTIFPYLIGMNETTNFVRFTSNVGNFTDTATVGIQFPLQVFKSVSSEPPPACGATGNIFAEVGSLLYYCYETVNISNMTIQYGVEDDQLGILASNRSLGAFSNDTFWANTTFPPGVRELTNVATWTVAGLPSMSGGGSATVYAASEIPAHSGMMLVLLGVALIVAATTMIRLG